MRNCRTRGGVRARLSRSGWGADISRALPWHPVPVLLVLLACADPDNPIEAAPDALPAVWIDTRGVDVDADELWDEETEGRTWTTVGLRIDVDGGIHWDGQAGLHVRGNSSAEEYPKKSYALETRDTANEDLDVSLLGLPAEEDWVLHGPYADKTLMRNALIYRWSNSIGFYASRTVFVELWLEDGGDALDDGDYQGVYVLMEKIKRDEVRVDLADLDPEDLTEPDISGGYLLKRDWIEEGDPASFLRTPVYRDELVLVDPDGTEITAEQRSWLTDWFGQVETALDGPDFTDPETGYAAWLDVDSFIDHSLIAELGRSVDAYVLSTWLYKDREGPLTMGPVWDYNGGLGNADYFGAEDPEGWHYENEEFPADNPRGFAWYERLLEDPAFRASYAARWAELRQGPLATEVLLADIDAWEAKLAGPAARNFERWEVLGEYVWPNAGGFEERDSFAAEVAYLRDWVEARTAWMDEALLGF